MAEPAHLAAWLAQQLDAIPPGGTLTVTWRRDQAGHLSREAILRREWREAHDELADGGKAIGLD
jgi:hypothetical protein